MPPNLMIKNVKKDLPICVIEPPSGVDRNMWLADESKDFIKKLTLDEEGMYRYEISSLRRRNGERRYLRSLRLGSMKNVIRYHDETTFGFKFMASPLIFPGSRPAGDMRE